MDCIYSDCINKDKKCHLCIDGYHYEAKKIKNVGFNKKIIKVKETKRQGSISEVKAYNQIRDIVSGTPNSGAGNIKGDLEIQNIVPVMIELKTTVKKNAMKANGKESFSIKKAWLDKLRIEAKKAQKEFYYLMWSFKETDDKFYCVIESEELNNMIATMVHDRQELNKTQDKIDIYKTKANLIEAENTKLLAEIKYLKAKLKVAENERKEE